MPSRLGRYAVRRRIGSGGFATVWLAYDEQLDAPVAIKVLADNWTEDHHVRTRFVEEGRYLRRVESPHVVSVYDAGELDDGRPYLVMTFADQGTLADRLESSGATAQQALEVVRQVGIGLQALHDRDILHRDVKPANVLFRTVEIRGRESEVRAMVGDLGLGKALDISSRLTMIAGTPAFVAPEQAQGETPGPGADQYSLAVLTYLLLTGRKPWQHTHLDAAADPSPPPPLSGPGREFAPAVEGVLRRALERDPALRWPSVTDYVEALQAAVTSRQVAEEGADPGPTQATWVLLDRAIIHPGVRPAPGRVGASSAITTLSQGRADESQSRVSQSGESGGDSASAESARTTTRADVHSMPKRSPLATGVSVGFALAIGAGIGWFGLGQAKSPVTVRDQDGALSVEVPREWRGSVSRGPWTPPNQDGEWASLSAGSTDDWQQDRDEHGVFVGLLPGTKLPTRLPGHPDCGDSEDVAQADVDGDPARTVYYDHCPGPEAAVVVERVVKVADDWLLWVQVKAADRDTVQQVLDSVELETR